MFTDCVTYCDIDPKNLIRIAAGDTCYHFDIDTLHRYYLTSGRLENPSTKTVLKEEDANKILAYGDDDKTSMIFLSLGKEFVYPTSILLGDLFLDLISKIGSKRLCCEVNIRLDGKSIFSYNLYSVLDNLKSRRIIVTAESGSSPSNLLKIKEFVGSKSKLVTIIDNELRYGSVKIF